MLSITSVWPFQQLQKNPFEIKWLPTELALCIFFFAGKLGFSSLSVKISSTFSSNQMCFLRNKSTQLNAASWKLRKNLAFCSPEKNKTSFGSFFFRIKSDHQVQENSLLFGESRALWLLLMAFNSKKTRTAHRDLRQIEPCLKEPGECPPIEKNTHKHKIVGKEPYRIHSLSFSRFEKG